MTRRLTRAELLASSCLLCAVPLSTARANPLGGQVVAGQASISAPNPSTVNVTQSSQRAVINWQSFSIAPGQTTQFQQPNAQAVTLNRVTGQDLSTIAGQLRANGQVILINQSGIVFSQGAEVNTGGLIATTADISSQGFVAGQTAFTVPSPKPHAGVVNRGRITVGQAGLAALVAPSVANSGVINATLGRVVLAGAQTFTADLYGDGLVSFDITSRVQQGPGGGQALVSNTGQITADGGHILLTADAVDGIIGDLVDAGGTLQARTLGGQAGEIDVVGNGQGVVAVSGLLDASGPAAGQRGGTITVLGDRVGLLDGASLTVSGQAAGGLALIGGNFHGGGTLQQARVTYVAPTAQVTADALGSGNGGAVAVWSDQQTAFYGAISARGGPYGGNGGQVEVSGANLDFTGIVDRSAPRGQVGSLLLDPAIVNIDNDTSTPNQDGKLPTILATDDPGATDHILATAIDLALDSGNVSIAATGTINVNGNIFGSGESVSSLSLTAPLITVGADISVGGNLALTGAVTLDNPFVTLQTREAFSAGQITGPGTLSISAGLATLHGVDVGQFIDSSFGVQLDSGTYTTAGQPLVFGTVTTAGTLVLGSPETDFTDVTLAADTVLDASAAAGVIKVSQVDAASSYGQGLSMLTSGSGVIELDGAGQIAPLKFLDVTGISTLGSGLPGTSTVFVNAGAVDIPGALTTGQTTTITTAGTGSITLGAVTGATSSGTVVTGLTLDRGTGSITLNGVDEASFYIPDIGPLRFDSGVYQIGTGDSASATFTGSVSTSGSLYFGQPTTFGSVVLAGNTSFFGYGRAVALTIGAVDSVSSPTPYSAAFIDTNLSALTLGPVGAVGALSALTVDIPGSTSLTGNISAASVSFASQAFINGAIAVNAPLGASFGTVEDAAAGTGTLQFTSSGNVTLGTVGAASNLAALIDSSTSARVSLDGDVFAGSVDLAGPVLLPAGGTTTIYSFTSGPITLGPVSGSAAELALTGGGLITLSGVELGSLVFQDAAPDVSLHAGTYTTGGTLAFGSVTTSGSLVLGSAETSFGNLTLATDTTLDATSAGGVIVVGSATATTAYGQGLTIATAGPGAGTLVFGTSQSDPLSFLTLTGPSVFGAPGGDGHAVAVFANAVDVPGPFETAESTSITTGALGSIRLGQALDAGGAGLSLSAGTGGITLAGVQEPSLAISSAGPVELTSGTYTIGDGGAYAFGPVATAGALYFGQPTNFGAVTLAGNTVFQGSGAPQALTLASLDSASGPFSVSFNGPDISQLSLGPVGASAPPSALSVNGANVTVLNGNVSSGTVAFSSPVVLGNPVNVDAPLGASFGSVDTESSSFSLAFTGGTGGVTLGPVGQAGPLEALIAASTLSTVTLTGNVSAGAVDLPGPVSIGAGTTTLISTLGTLGASGPITLGAVSGPGADLELQAGAGNVSLAGVSASALSVATTGIETLNGGTYALSGVGTLAFGNVTTNGTLFLPQATDFGRVVLASDTTLDMTESSPLSLGQASGAATLTLIGGDVTLGGLTTAGFVSELTGTETLTTGTYGVGGGTYAFGEVATAGTLTFEQPTSFSGLRLQAATTLDSASVGAALSLGPASGPFSLTIEAGAGTVSLAGVDTGALAIGGSGVLTLNAGGYTVATGSLALGNVTTNGALTFGQPTTLGVLTLASDTSLATNGPTPLTFGGGVGGGFALDATAGQGNLTVTGPIDGVGSLVLAGGSVLLDGAVGGVTQVGSVAIDSAAGLAVSQAISAAGAVALDASAPGSDITIAAPVRSSAAGVTVAAAGSVDVAGSGALSGQTVALGAFGGTLGIAGLVAPVGDAYLAASGGLMLDTTGRIQAGGSVSADAGGNVTLAAGGMLTAGGDLWIGYGASGNAVFSQFGFTAPSGVAGALSDGAAITAGGNVGLDAAGGIAVQAPVTAGTGAAGGSVFLAAAGAASDIVVGGTVSATAGTGAGSGTVFLDASGNIDEQGASPGAIQAAVLVGQSGGWAALGGQNRVATLGGFQASGQIAATTDSNHVAGSSFTFADASPLTITAAAYSLAAPVSAGGAPTVTQAMSAATIAGPGGVAISAPGLEMQLTGSVSIASGSFLALAAADIAQTGTLSLSAPLSLIDISGVPSAGMAAAFGANGAAGLAAFASGRPQSFLNAYEAAIAGSGQAGAGSLQLESVRAETPGSNLVLATDQGRISGIVDAAGLSVVSAGGAAALTGMVDGQSGPAGAMLGHTSFGALQASQDTAVVFDGCDLGATVCGVVAPTMPTLAQLDVDNLPIVVDLPLQPQLVTDVTGVLGNFLPGIDPQQSQTVARTIELLPFDEIQQEHALDDIEVDRLDTGREDVQ